MPNNLISVIVPIYNVEPYLRRCIDSILSQTYKDFEFILVDDGSPDNCPKICDEYAKKDERIRVVHKENGGVSSARNAGIEIAKGKYVSFIDPDDCLDSVYYERLVEGMEKGADLVLSGCIDETEEGNFSWAPNSPERYTLEELKAHFDPYFGNGTSCMKLYRRELIGGIRFEVGVAMNEDYLFNLAYCARCKLFVVAKDAHYICNRLDHASATHTYKPEYFSCRIKRYVQSKLFLYDEVVFKNDFVDKTFALDGLLHIQWACSQKLPKSERKKQIKLILDNELFQSVLIGDPMYPKDRFPVRLCRGKKRAALVIYYKMRRLYSNIRSRKG